VERRLGAVLFDRSTRPVELTAAGKLYYEFCRDILHREEQFERDLGAIQREIQGLVRVASIYSIGISEMSHLQEAFSARYPAAQLHVEYMRPEKVYQAVRNEWADLGLVSYPAANREIAAIPWRNETMQVATAPSHPFAQLSELSPADLNGQDFVAFDEDLTIRRELDRFLRSHGVTVTTTMHFDNIQMIKEAVALGSGISILPARTMQAEIEQGRLISIPLEAPALVRPLGIIHRRKKKFTRAMQSLLGLLQEQEPEPAA
jgi:DNA-binding transcriptional LysR family regulator